MGAATITPEQAAERLRAVGMKISPTIVREGMAQGQFPFGSYIKTEKSCVCFVYPRLLERWIVERFGGEKMALNKGTPPDGCASGGARTKNKRKRLCLYFSTMNKASQGGNHGRYI